MIIYKHTDDLGITLANSNSILQAWENKYIQGFSIVANAVTHEFIKNRLLKNAEVPARVAVHLNLTDGYSAASKETIPLLVDRSGRLKVSFLKALFTHIIGGKRREFFLQQVEIEWKHQIEKVKDCIQERKITFLDSHYHIHMVPSLFKLTIKLCRLYNIPQVRRSREFFYFSDNTHDNLSIYFFINTLKHFLLNFLSRFNKIPLPLVPSADYIAGVLFSTRMNKSVIKEITAVAEKKKISSLEIVFHIGYTDQVSLYEWTTNKGTRKHYSSKGPENEWKAVKQIYYGG